MTVISNGQTLDLSTTDISGAVVLAGGRLLLEGANSTNESYGTRVFGGGLEIVSGVADALGTTVYKAAALIDAGGSSQYSQILSGGTEYLEATGDRAGFSQSAIVFNGGTQIVYPHALTQSGDIFGQLLVRGGYADLTTIESSGTVTVYGRGTDSLATVFGTETVLSNGLEVDSLVGHGGLAFITSGGFVAGMTVQGGGTLNVASGGVVESDYNLPAGWNDRRGVGLNISGGTAVIDGSVTFATTVRFEGGGNLMLSNLSEFHGRIAGFSTGATIDLAGFAFASDMTKEFIAAASGTSGTLVISGGGHSASLGFYGNYNVANITLADDHAGGTLIGHV